MPRLKVLISGAGIAGNALAFWLSRLGHDVTVIERFPCLRVNGLQLDLRGHGIEVMKRMGLEQAFRSNAAPEQGLQLVDKSGRRWGYFPASKSGGEVQSITSEFEIMRKDLCQIMYDATKDRTKYVFGKSIDSFKENENSLDLHLSDGTMEQYDLLVGADGQGSRTRKMMLGSDQADGLRLTNECVAYFTIARPIQKGEEYIATSYIATGGRWVLTRRHKPDVMQVYLTSKNMTQHLQNVRRGDVEEEKKAFIEVFRGAGWEVDTILDALESSTDDFYCERQGLVKLDSWSQGRVTLVGDAGYCPSADIGMGTTSAMIGAYVLAGEIGTHCGRANDEDDSSTTTTMKQNLSTALKAYEDRFRPFMEQIQKGVGEPSIFDHFPWTPLTIAILNRLMWFASFARLDLLAGWFLNQKVSSWDLPEYRELVEKTTTEKV